MKKLTLILLLAIIALSACSQTDSHSIEVEGGSAFVTESPFENEAELNINPKVSIYVNSADEVAQKIIEAVPNAKITQIRPDGIQTIALDYTWEETDKISALLAENATDGRISGAKSMTGISKEEEDVLKSQNRIRLVVTLIPVAMLSE